RAVGMRDAVIKVSARIDVLDDDGPGGGTVALPQFAAVHVIVVVEKQRAVHLREAKGRALEAFDEGGAGPCAVALPQAGSGTVVGPEPQRAVDVRETAGS